MMASRAILTHVIDQEWSLRGRVANLGISTGVDGVDGVEPYTSGMCDPEGAAVFRRDKVHLQGLSRAKYNGLKGIILHRDAKSQG